MMDNPRAFPSFEHEVLGKYAYYPGMSLRDWFAGQALAGLLAMGVGPIDKVGAAYVMADEMLRRRLKEPSDGQSA